MGCFKVKLIKFVKRGNEFRGTLHNQRRIDSVPLKCRPAGVAHLARDQTTKQVVENLMTTTNYCAEHFPGRGSIYPLLGPA